MSGHTRNHSTDAGFDAEAERLERAVGGILFAGAIAALALIAAGTITSFVHHPDYATSPSSLAGLTSPGGNTMQTILQVEAGILNFRGRAVVMAGLLLLILMPVVRVAVMIVVFAHRRDWTYM